MGLQLICFNIYEITNITKLNNAEPFSGLVSSIFFRLPALLGRVKDFVTMGCLLLAADFPGSKNFLLSQNKQNYIFYNIQGVRLIFVITLRWQD